jgi:hypothetical protein
MATSVVSAQVARGSSPCVSCAFHEDCSLKACMNAEGELVIPNRSTLVSPAARASAAAARVPSAAAASGAEGSGGQVSGLS